MDYYTKINVPQTYLDELQNILNKMEKETGRTFQFKVQEFGGYDNQCVYVGKFSERKGKVEIYDVKAEYIVRSYRIDEKDEVVTLPYFVLELNGVYESVEEAMKKVCDISKRAQNAQALDKYFGGLKFMEAYGTIDIGEGGSISEVHSVGKWRHVK
jgi:hypothetical protein